MALKQRKYIMCIFNINKYTYNQISEAHDFENLCIRCTTLYIRKGAKLLIMFFIHGIRPFLYGENNHYRVQMQRENSKIKTLRK